MPLSAELALQFAALHASGDIFVMPNAWDAGSARLLQSLGFLALGTTSAGYAFCKGKRDSAAALTRAEILANAAEIVEATSLPVSADLEDGFGASPDACATTVQGAIAIGLAGGAIEDASGDPDLPIYAFDQAVERIAAAVEARADSLFVITARSENFLCGTPDLSDTIRRLQAFCDAGADVVYAPGLPSLDAIRTVCAEVPKPVNVVMGLRPPYFTLEQLAEAGVRRVSTGGSLARAAFGALDRAAKEILSTGSFDYTQDAMPGADLAALMPATPRDQE
jgi:2-methylisocitrate lyase-like PEP mutase family enzyme